MSEKAGSTIIFGISDLSTGDLLLDTLSGLTSPPSTPGQKIGPIGGAFSSFGLVLSGQLAVAGSSFSGAQQKIIGSAPARDSYCLL